MEHNLSIAQKHSPASKIWAVIKADGYGHGLERSMRGFRNADGLSVIESFDAVRLRELGWSKPILLLEGIYHDDDLSIVLEKQLHIVVHCFEQIEMLERMPNGTLDGPGIHVYLKINTGLNRLGFSPRHTSTAHSRLRAAAIVRSISLMTHFANSYSLGNPPPGISVSEQVSRFNSASCDLDGERSLSDSAMLLTRPEITADWVRPGVMLYGATVFPGIRASDLELLPAMTLESELIGIQQIAPGDSVGYGSRFKAQRAMAIGVVACGYTYGYPRSATDGTPILVDGIRTEVVGRVSMDKLTVDLTPVANARVGSKVVLWGQGLPIEEVAEAANTISCELMCGLSQRVRVVFE
jgi:alanine racemase